VDQFWCLVGYLQTHPLVDIAIVVAVAYISYRLSYRLNRKSEMSCELDRRLEQLRRDRGDYYTKLRPLK
jgi:hypothetical protein